MEYRDYLSHFNPNHNPKDGKFTKKSGSSTLTRAAVTGAIIGTGFAAERAITIARKYPDASHEAMLKSYGIAFGRAAVASALAVIGNDLVRDYKSKKAVKNDES